MKRSICWFAVLGVLVVPGLAAACWPLWCQPVYPRPFYAAPPVYSTAAYPPVYVVPPYPPAFGYPQTFSNSASGVTTPAKVDPIPKTAVPTPAPATASPGKTGSKDLSAPAPTTGGENKPVAPKPPMNPPTDVPSLGQEPSPKTADPVTPAQSNGTLPKLELPNEPETRNARSSDAPKKPIPAATPTPAPADPLFLPIAPSKGAEPTLTLPGATVPAVPNAAPSDPIVIPSAGLNVPNQSKPSSLPPVTLPPEVPVKQESISRSSPLTGGAAGVLDVKRFPVVVAQFGGGVYRTVSFYNHTASDISLTIEGRAVKLPSKSYVETKLAPAFSWSYGDKAAVSEKVPEGAAGLDVVFRE